MSKYACAAAIAVTTGFAATLSAATLLQFDFQAPAASNVYAPSFNSLTGTTPAASVNAGPHSEWGTDGWSSEAISGSGQTLAYATWDSSASFMLNMDTTGFKDLAVSFKYIIEGTAPTFAAEYSVAGGGWTSLSPAPMTGNTVGALYSADLTSIAAVNNAANVALRFSFTDRTANMKIDDLMLTGTVVPEPAMLGLLALIPAALLRRRGA